MFAAIAGLAASAGMAGVNAAKAGRAREEQRRQAAQSRREYAKQYRDAYQDASRKTYDTALDQQMAMARSGGSSMSQSAATQAAAQRAPQAAAAASLAAGEIARGQLSGAQQQQAMDAAQWLDYDTRSDSYDSRNMGMLGNVPAVAAGLGQAMRMGGGAAPVVDYSTPSVQRVPGTAMAQPGPTGSAETPMSYSDRVRYSGGYSEDASIDPYAMDDEYFR